MKTLALTVPAFPFFFQLVFGTSTTPGISVWLTIGSTPIQENEHSLLTS
ncbi:MAG: hypothetical protein H0W49_11925 [Nitrospirales bacterium]|nr:hypothetical protein [Nitrospirales bacterium]